jgi:hypothetical protein
VKRFKIIGIKKLIIMKYIPIHKSALLDIKIGDLVSINRPIEFCENLIKNEGEYGNIKRRANTREICMIKQLYVNIKNSGFFVIELYSSSGIVEFWAYSSVINEIFKVINET